MPNAPPPVSHYRLLELIGQGAMGEVWLAEDTQLPRKVAVKLLLPSLAADADLVQRLMREAGATARIDHPAVATVYEAGQVEGRPYLVMQYFTGETLDRRLARGPLPVSEVLSLATVVADALAEVHALGIVHRDLKPSNIMLTSRGPKILDFGVAVVQASARLTTPGTVVGTPVTMAPEQVNGLPADNRSDLWALGVILYRALTGVFPFSGSLVQDLFREILQHDPRRPSSLRDGIPPDLDYVVTKLLRKEPAHRYGRAEDLLADLSSCSAAVSGGSEEDTRTAIRTADTSADPPRLAVLPFEVLSSDDDVAFMATGLVEDLIVDLTRVERLRVASRAEVASYAERRVPPRTLARELRADFVVTGSVRRSGERARISAQLVRARDSHLLWAERFDRTLRDLFAVQAEVSRRIVDALQVAVGPAEQRMLERVPSRNTEAYALYLRARELLETSPDSNRLGERLLKQALELDPDFALAHAALGECYARRGLLWWAELTVADPALACAQRALELEPGLPDAYYVELMVRRLEGDPQKVLEAIDKVLKTLPDDFQAREWAGWSYLALGQPEQALPILEDLTDRYSALSHLGACYRMLGRDADADRTQDLLHERLVEILRRNPDTVHVRTLLAIALAREGDAEGAVAQAERAIALAPEDGRTHYNAACAFAIAGMPARALAQLQEGTKNLPSYLTDWPRRDPDLASLHTYPEFVKLFGTATAD